MDVPLFVISIFMYILLTFSGGACGEHNAYSLVRRDAQVKENNSMSIMTCDCHGVKNVVISKEFKLISDFVGSNCASETDKMFCDLIQSCENCAIDSHQCTANEENGFCIKSTFSFRAQPSKELLNPKQKDLSALSRSERSLEGKCPYPSTLKTADIACTSYPNFITCRQRCIFGYTFRDGISREMSCKGDENVWKPIGFEECHPFVDCNLSLVSTGTVDCMTATTTEAPVCNVTCEQHEDKQPVAKQKYECKITGTWAPRLPFCVIPGSGLDLVSAPRIKAHGPR